MHSRRDTTMQAMTFPRSTMSCVAITGLAIILLAAVTLVLIRLNTSDSEHDEPVAVSDPSMWVTQADESRTMEQNTELPTSGASDQVLLRSSSQAQYLEQNLWLPMGTASVSLLAPDQQQN